MLRVAQVLTALIFASAALAQVPPGVSYDPQKHPNPVVTFVRNQDFKTTTYADAQKRVGFDPLGLSEKEGKRTSIAVADPKPATQNIDLPNDDYPQIKVEFFPVFRQTYKLVGGDELTLDAFQFPKVPIPLNLMSDILNYAAFLPGDKLWKPRFGIATTPERVTVRRLAALLFDDNAEHILFWREGSICYSVKSKAPRADLFRIMDDLL